MRKKVEGGLARWGSRTVERYCAVVAACLAAVVAAGSAAADTPLPVRPAGTPSGATSAAGQLAGKSFVAASAIVERDFYGDLNVYLFRRERGCGRISVVDAPYVWISIDTGGQALPLTQPLASGGP